MPNFTVTQPNSQFINDNPGQRAVIVTWNLTTAVTFGDYFCTALYRPVCVQYRGTWDTGQMNFNGSVDGVNSTRLENINGDAIGPTANGIDSIGPWPAYIRPLLNAPGASTDIVISVLCVRG